MNLAGYLRVSTEAQASDGYGLDTQRDTIGAWCRDHGHRVTTWHVDEGISGSNGIDTRAALADALETVGPESGIVVARLDRFARSLVIQEQLLAEIKRRGGVLRSCDAVEDAYLDDADADPDPTRTMVRQILGAVADYERGMIRARMLAGQRRKAAAGGYAYGGPPYGWASDGHGNLVPVPWEQGQIDIARALRASGTSLRGICKVLDDSGAPPRRGAKWHPDVIRKILNREQPRHAASPDAPSH